MTREEQFKILEQFFGECVRYWEHTLKISSDDSNEPYINAIKEIPRQDPYTWKNPEKFDEDVVEEFKRYRLMDCFGID